MSSNQNFFASHSWKKFVNICNNVGASVVIVGAMFKISHLPGGDIIIGAGLITEAFLFLLGALEPLPQPLHWERAYPEIIDNGNEEENPFDEQGHVPANRAIRSNMVAQSVESEQLSQKLDKLLSEAGIDANLISNLSRSISELSNSTSQLSNIGTIGQDAKRYAMELESASKNVEALNKLYQMQIESTTAQVSASKVVVSNMANTLENSKVLEGEVRNLAENLHSLNDVYGGMLSAMGRK